LRNKNNNRGLQQNDQTSNIICYEFDKPSDIKLEYPLLDSNNVDDMKSRKIIKGKRPTLLGRKMYHPHQVHQVLMEKRQTCA